MTNKNTSLKNLRTYMPNTAGEMMDSETYEDAPGAITTYYRADDIERLLASTAVERPISELRKVAQRILERWERSAPSDEISGEHKALRAALSSAAVEQAEPAIQGKTISDWYVAWCEMSGKLKGAKACIGRYQKLVSDLEELSKPRQSVPDNIIRLIQDYGDARADDDRYAASKFGDAITAIRRLIASQAAPAAPEQAKGGDFLPKRDVAELPDRDSPAGQPDMMLVSGDELRDIIAARAPKASGSDGTAAAGAGSQAEFDAVMRNARAVVKRWDSALWRQEVHTADFIDQLRKSLDAAEQARLPIIADGSAATSGSELAPTCQPTELTGQAAGAVCQPLADEQTMCIFPICTCAGRDTCVRAQKAVVPAKRSAIERIADELEDEAQPYEGEFADVVRGCVEALRELTIGAPSPAAEADQDAARLDYLEKYAVIAAPGQSIRAAIDAAMSQAKGAGKEGAA
jgi:hypothetical protein